MDSTPLRFLHFELSGTSCALPISQVREVLPMAKLLRPPHLPSMLEGFLNIAGVATPILRLDRVLGLSLSEPTASSHLIWLRESSTPMILLVERVHSVFTVTNHEMLSLKEHQTFNHCVVSQVQHNDINVHILSVEKLLLTQERKTVEEFALLSQKRLFSSGRESA